LRSAPRPIRIVSGGQTGVDRAALDVALELGTDCGGWVPAGRGAEDGRIPHRYPNLREADAAEPAVRTRLNVRDSDATLLVTRGVPAGGSALTRELAGEIGRPLLHVDLARLSRSDAAAAVRSWLDHTRPGTLNVAGPRESEAPGIYGAARALLSEALAAEDGRRDTTA
jgi:hypothetical protein